MLNANSQCIAIINQQQCNLINYKSINFTNFVSKEGKKWCLFHTMSFHTLQLARKTLLRRLEGRRKLFLICSCFVFRTHILHKLGTKERSQRGRTSFEPFCFRQRSFPKLSIQQQALLLFWVKLCYHCVGDMFPKNFTSTKNSKISSRVRL